MNFRVNYRLLEEKDMESGCDYGAYSNGWATCKMRSPSFPSVDHLLEYTCTVR